MVWGAEHGVLVLVQIPRRRLRLEEPRELRALVPEALGAGLNGLEGGAVVAAGGVHVSDLRHDDAGLGVDEGLDLSHVLRGPRAYDAHHAAEPSNDDVLC